METTLKVRQLRDLGLLDKVIDYLDLDLSLLKDDGIVTFDSEFKEKKKFIIPNRHEVYSVDDSIKFILEVINDCVICISYSINHSTYNLEYMSLEIFNKYYAEGLQDDEYYKDTFLEEVKFSSLG